MRVVLRYLVLAVGLVVLCMPGEVAAQGDDAEARRAFRLGRAHYENGDFAEAATEFERAYQASGRSRLLYNAYLAYRDAQDLPNAARVLRTFLTESPDAPEHDQLSARLRVIEESLASRESQQQPDPGPAEDADPVQDPQPVLEPQSADTYSDPADPAPVSDAPASEYGGASDESSGGGLNIGWIVGGAGAALIVTGVVTGLLASGELSTLEDGCSAGDVCPTRLEGTKDSGQTLALVTDVLLITGVLAVGTGAALLFLLDGEEEDQSGVRAGLGCGPNGCVGTLSSTF